MYFLKPSLLSQLHSSEGCFLQTLLIFIKPFWFDFCHIVHLFPVICFKYILVHDPLRRTREQSGFAWDEYCIHLPFYYVLVTLSSMLYTICSVHEKTAENRFLNVSHICPARLNLSMSLLHNVFKILLNIFSFFETLFVDEVKHTPHWAV